MSRKSIESSSICSRRRTSVLRLDTSSSGAIVERMSLMAMMISSRFMGGGSALEAPDDDGGVDAEHAEGEVQDVVDAAELLRLVHDEIPHLAGRVEMVDVDRGMHPAVVERRQIARQLERAGRAHRVADVALRVVDVRAG